MRLDIEKSTQALNYFARAEGGTIDKMKALKLLFFADRYHLRQYGRPVSRDRYLAMKYGPVASAAYDLLRGQKTWVGDEACEFAHRFVRPIANAAGVIIKVASATPPELDVFSESDLEALEFAWTTFGTWSGRELSLISHVYPEWARHEAALLTSKAVEMDYLDFFGEPPAEACEALEYEDPFRALADAERLEVAREVYQERLRLDTMMAA